MKPTERKKDLIFLTGYMGAGKSTIGLKLAKVLKYEHIDTDRALEKRFRKTMSDIFAVHGEKRFREEEERLIERLSEKHNYVVSTGGGTLTRMETFFTAQRSGVLIYLQAPVDVLYQRVIFSQKDRPLINQDNSDVVFKERFAKREKYYIKADFTVNTDDRPSDDVVADIVKWLKQQ